MSTPGVVNIDVGGSPIEVSLPGQIPLIEPLSPAAEHHATRTTHATQTGGISLFPIPGVEIRGDRAGNSADGLIIDADDCHISGLIITSFSKFGVSVNGCSGTFVTCNNIGVAIDGSSNGGNSFGGISIEERCFGQHRVG